MGSWGNKILTIGVAAFLGYLLWSELGPSEKSSSSRSSEPVKEDAEPEEKPPQRAVKKKQRAKPPASKQQNVSKPSDKKGMSLATQQFDPRRGRIPRTRDQVEFEVKGEYAVAFGDTIIGRVKDGKTGQRGVYEPPRPGLWPSNVIPYHINENLKNTVEVEKAINYLNQQTALEFVPFQGEANAIHFYPGEEHCYSFLGMTGGHQPILLSEKCGMHEILHEIMHALGFVHEQSRIDRDRFVKVQWENIQPQFFNQFDIVPDSLVHDYMGSVFHFDYKSIMLYEDHFFAKESGLKTMTSTTNKDIQPSRNQLSDVDKERIYYLYGQ